MVVIRDAPGPTPHGSNNMHILYDTKAEFEHKLRQGHELAQWTVRYGKFLSGDREWWAKVRSEVDSYPWPDWHTKLNHFDKRIRLAEKALGDQDELAAEEELLMAASHLARAHLLRRGIFPLSRPELASQLLSIEDNELSDILSSLSRGRLGESKLQRILVTLKSVSERPVLGTTS